MCRVRGLVGACRAEGGHECGLTLLVSVGGCGSFFSIAITHPSFKGLMTIKQHRMVNEVLKDDIKEMHGIQVSQPDTRPIRALPNSNAPPWIAART